MDDPRQGRRGVQRQERALLRFQSLIKKRIYIELWFVLCGPGSRVSTPECRRSLWNLALRAAAFRGLGPPPPSAAWLAAVYSSSSSSSSSHHHEAI